MESLFILVVLQWYKCLNHPLDVVESTFMQGKDDTLLQASIVLMVKQLICTQYLRVQFLLEALINIKNMAELEEKKETKRTTKKVIETPQEMRILVVTNIAEVVKYVNEEGIKKEDIISLLKDNGQWMLVYYK